MNSDLIGHMKQELYKSSQIDVSLAADEAAKIADCVSQLETEKVKLSNEIDALEQYSRRNCLIVHGVPDTANPETAVLDTINNKLGVPNGCESIDRCHRLGSPANSTNSRPRPISVKFMSYQARQNVFSGKRHLKGTKLLITENLTRRRSELLNKAKTLNNVTATWTSEGRIVCLLSSGRKVFVTTVQDRRQLDQQ